MIKRLLLVAALALGFHSHAAEPARIVFMIGEGESKTWETLPDFAKKELKTAGHRVTIIHADAADKNDFPGIIEALRVTCPTLVIADGALKASQTKDDHSAGARVLDRAYA